MELARFAPGVSRCSLRRRGGSEGVCPRAHFTRLRRRSAGHRCPGLQPVARGLEDLTRSREGALAAGLLLFVLGALVIGAILSAGSRRGGQGGRVPEVER